MWKNDLTQKDGKCLPFFNSGCVGVFPSSSSSGRFLKTQNKKVNFLYDVNENTTDVYKKIGNKVVEWNGFSYKEKHTNAVYQIPRFNCI